MSDYFVSVVIPTQNRSAKLRRLLQSVVTSKVPSGKIEIIVVVDNCVDDTLEVLKNNFPDVVVVLAPIQPKDCLFGSAPSRDLGASYARAPYICFVDDDNIVDSQMFTHLVAALENDRTIGIVGPVMFYWPDGNGIWCAGMKKNRLGLNSYIRSETIWSLHDESGLLEPCDFIPNAFCTRQSTLKLVPFDVKHFPHNGSELDWGIRLRERGLTVRISLRAIDWHDLEYRSFVTRIERPVLVHDQSKTRVVLRSLHPNEFGSRLIFWTVVFPLTSLYFFAKFLRSGHFFALSRAYILGTFEGLRASS